MGGRSECKPSFSFLSCQLQRSRLLVQARSQQMHVINWCGVAIAAAICSKKDCWTVKVLVPLQFV